MLRSHSRFRIVGVAVGAATLSIVAALSMTPTVRFAPAAAPTPFVVPTAREDAVYLLRDYDGELCVFSGQRLIQHTGIPVSALPAADRELLREGIRAESRQELYTLLEDLAS